MRAIHYSVPLVLLVVFSTIMVFLGNQSWVLGIGIGIVGLVSLFFLKDAIDWKYYIKNPPGLEAPILKLLTDIPFYKQLTLGDKSKFEQRLALFMIAHEYKMQPTKRSADDEAVNAPEDLKAICSIPAIILTFYEENYLFKEIEQIVLYNHPFPSPRYHELHSCESNKEDKVLIFSLPHLEKGVKDPFTYFDIGMYEWARISENISYHCIDWHHFTLLHGIPKEAYEKVIGLPHIDLPAVCRVTEIHQGYLNTIKY